MESWRTSLRCSFIVFCLVCLGFEWIPIFVLEFTPIRQKRPPIYRNARCPWICHISIKLVPTSIWGINGDDVAVNLTDGLPCQMPHKQGLNWSILTKKFKDEIDWFQKILCNIVLVNFYLLSNRSVNYIKKPSNKSVNNINIYPIWSLKHIFAEQSKNDRTHNFILENTIK